MREIKFRAWHTVKKLMFSPEEMGQDQLTIMPDGRGFINVSSDDTRLSEFMPHLIPEQYTGLKDNKGYEIYEGDILKCNGGAEDFLFEVAFDNDRARFVAKVPWVDGKEISYPGLEYYIGWKFIPVCEVIGNIHENLELLKHE